MKIPSESVSDAVGEIRFDDLTLVRLARFLLGGQMFD